MDTYPLGDFFEDINFEIVEIDDHNTLFFELTDDGDYATVTNEDGNLPNDLNAPVIFSVYDENNVFQWSVTIDDAELLKEIFQRFDSTEELLATLKDMRLENIAKIEN